MANGQISLVIRQLRSFLGAQDARTSTDGELLERFVTGKEEAAYASLVERYAPLVLGVCRRVLQDEHDAEDVFQATFLVLWRKASVLDGHGALANWLYTVAYHLALKAKARANQRRVHERQVTAMPDVATHIEPHWQELRPLLDEELDRLPPKYRSPMVLCYLVGKTNEQAAQELGWTKDTVRGRLAKARALLRNRLTRRGVTMSATALGALLAENVAKAAVPVGWVDGTLKAAALLGTGSAATTGISSSVAMLVDGFFKEMMLLKLKVAAAVLLAISVATTGIGISAYAGKTPASAPDAAPAKPGPRLVWLKSGSDDKEYIVEPIKDCPEEMAKEEVGAEESMPETPMTAEDEPVDDAPPPAKKVVIKRRNWACEEELRKQLLFMPELRLDADLKDRPMMNLILERAKEAESSEDKHVTPGLLAARPDLAGLPLRQGADCELSAEAARNLRDMSLELRQIIGETLALEGDRTLVALALRKNFKDSKANGNGSISKPLKVRYREAAAVPTLMQMLPADEAPVRQVLVEQLARINHRASSQALARLAMFDLSPEVRAEAVQVLAQRPRDDYRQVLLEGFRYPWVPAADHAAEALVALEDHDAVPALNQLVKEPDPSAPIYDQAQDRHMVREVVRINHLRNCMMCHAPGSGTVSAPLPVAGQPLPPLFKYYQGNDGIIVRAEATYIRQDFSVAQPVEKTHPWPKMQRFDYVIRQRPVTLPEPAMRFKNERPATYPQREAALYAIKELTAK